VRKGFTLLELLVVLVIISIAAGLVGPRVAGSMSNLSLKTAAKKVAGALRYARSQATSESRPYFVLFDPEKGRLSIKSGQTATKEVKEKKAGEGEEEAGTSEKEAEDKPAKETSKVYDLPEDVRFGKVEFDKDEAVSGVFQIVFFPNGGSSGGEVLLENDRGRQYTIRVDFVSGAVRLEDVDTGPSKRRAYSI